MKKIKGTSVINLVAYVENIVNVPNTKAENTPTPRLKRRFPKKYITTNESIPKITLQNRAEKLLTQRFGKQQTPATFEAAAFQSTVT